MKLVLVCVSVWILGSDSKTKLVFLGTDPQTPKCFTTDFTLCSLKFIYYGWAVVNVSGLPPYGTSSRFSTQ